MKVKDYDVTEHVRHDDINDERNSYYKFHAYVYVEHEGDKYKLEMFVENTTDNGAQFAEVLEEPGYKIPSLELEHELETFVESEYEDGAFE